jgi:polyphosphate kinase
MVKRKRRDKSRKDQEIALPAASPERFLNRELSQLAFNERVLALAARASIPLAERLRYLCIVSSNLDEFFEIRVAGLMEELRESRGGGPASPLWQEFMRISERAHALVDRQYALFNQTLAPALARHGVVIVNHAERTPAQRAWVREQFQLPEAAVYRVDGPVNLVRLNQLVDHLTQPALRWPPFAPAWPAKVPHSTEGADMFEAMRAGDILLHHPFESFEPVIEFLRQAALDPKVVAIRMTLYRTGTGSVLVDLLIEAARRGKEVTVVVELKARFDEEANINLAERLEAVGVQVVYGVVELKTHAKLLLVVRREEDGPPKKKGEARARLAHYAHLGTGNYHPTTTKLYTDFGMLTCEPEICADVEKVFMHLTSLTKVEKLTHLWLAPFTLHKRVLAAIANESKFAAAGKPGRIIAKMNALVDEATINALYAASQAGVKIDLIVRGACMLRPGVKGLSENIRVRSVVGRFLEHHRIYYFRNGGADDVYLASADWMGRNLFRRIEVAWPVLDKKLKQRVLDEGLRPYLDDTADAWTLQGDGSYRPPKALGRGDHGGFSAQRALLVELAASVGEG